MKDIIELTKCKLITSKIEKCKTKIALSKLLKKQNNGRKEIVQQMLHYSKPNKKNQSVVIQERKRTTFYFKKKALFPLSNKKQLYFSTTMFLYTKVLSKLLKSIKMFI